MQNSTWIYTRAQGVAACWTLLGRSAILLSVDLEAGVFQQLQVYVHPLLWMVSKGALPSPSKWNSQNLKLQGKLHFSVVIDASLMIRWTSSRSLLSFSSSFIDDHSRFFHRRDCAARVLSTLVLEVKRPAQEHARASRDNATQMRTFQQVVLPVVAANKLYVRPN